ncbi:hypothetical protein [Laspinema palackyanum]|uniref:hypothetical protein n=1 Tax=Laspinema palackyanum TaxID=3231601 RepID=UPI00345CB6FE|nr:hypothetical protein [Laspinema sp. D2c]
MFSTWGDLMDRRDWLNIAEYVSLAAVVLGSVLAAISGQVIYAAAPVIVSLGLNLVNRRRQSMPSRVAVEEVKIAPEAMKMTIAQEIEPVVVAVRQLRSRSTELEQTLTVVTTQLQRLRSEFKERPELEEVESLAEVITALQQCLDGLPAGKPGQTPIAELEREIVQAIARIPSIVEVEVQQQLQKLGQVPPKHNP